MKELKVKRLVKFDGRCSSWSGVDEHNRNLRAARALDASGFGQFVRSTELAPQVSSDGDTVKLSECTYYDSDGPTLVTDAEFKALKKAGVAATVIGIYEDEHTRYSDVVFYGLVAAFAAWNIAALLKFVGVL